MMLMKICLINLNKHDLIESTFQIIVGSKSEAEIISNLRELNAKSEIIKS